jgi:hypothetical protein
VVTVMVQEALSAQIHVIGEVEHPGTQVMQGPRTVLQALAEAGGLKEFADRNNIHVLRKRRQRRPERAVQLQGRAERPRRRDVPAAGRHARRAVARDEEPEMLNQRRRAASMTRVVLALGVSLTMLGHAQAQTVRWAPARTTPGWVFTPAVLLGGGWDSNVTVQNQGNPELHEWVGVVNPRGEIDFNGRRTHVNGGYSGALEAYRQLNELQRFEQRAKLEVRHNASRRVVLEGYRVVLRGADHGSTRSRRRAAAIHRYRVAAVERRRATRVPHQRAHAHRR